MPDITLIIPGFQNSGPDHWQTWMESRVNGARRVSGIDWEAPILDDWAAAVRREVMQTADPVWLVAHSFGCLATIAAIQGLAHRIAGAMLVAPPDPDWFTPLGVRTDAPDPADSLASVLPRRDLGIPSLIVASSNDPWMPIEKLVGWSESWGSRLVNIGNAGHINTDAGFGPWPAGLELFRSLQTLSESDHAVHRPIIDHRQG
jgi:predicted alpha/beta hydrolase family esterase